MNDISNNNKIKENVTGTSRKLEIAYKDNIAVIGSTESSAVVTRWSKRWVPVSK